MNKNIRIIDTTLRDGMHAMAHQFTVEQMAVISELLDKAGVDTIEVSHGDGLGGSSLQYGLAKATDEEYLRTVSSILKNAKLAILLLPGVGTKKNLEMAVSCGATVARIATHVTEADIAEQHIQLAKKLGMEAIGVLMLVHMREPAKILEQAKLMESYGADGIYMMDSAGALLPEGVKKRVAVLSENLSVPVGFHAHNNLSFAVANTITAIENGADMVDATLKGLGAGSGNTQHEVLIGAMKKLNYPMTADFYGVMDAAEALASMMKRPQVIDNSALMLGYAGVYSSFLLHTYKAAKKYNVDPRNILVELGKKEVVGGQEDMIISVALQLAEQKRRGGSGF